MSVISSIRTVLEFLFRRQRGEREMEEELRLHLRRRADDLERLGLSRLEAERQARLEFGGYQRYKEECREALATRLIGELLADVRYGLRQLRRNPGFTAVAVITLALGIGANTAMFSMINGILLQALPYQQPQRLYTINEVVPQWSRYAPYFGVNSGNFLLWQERCPAFSSMAELGQEKFDLTGTGRPRQVHAAAVPTGFFSMMGVRPELGRGFLPEEDQRGHEHEVVLTAQFWRQVFNADPRIIGKSVTLGNAPYTVVGVLPASFRFPEVWGGAAPEIFNPVVLAGYDLDPGLGNFNYTVIARLKPGVTARQALAELNVVETGIARRGDGVRHVAPGQFDLRAMLTPLKTAVVGPAQKAFWMLEVAAAFVLLIVCVNLANLMLAKNAGRTREVAVRSALGATGRRMARQFLTEGALLATAGGGLGLLFAAWGLELLVRNAPVGIPRVNNVHIDPKVLLFTLGISVIAALLFAALPAIRLARTGPAGALKSAGPTVSCGKTRARLRGGLVIGEVALCAVLLVGALLLIQSLAHVARANEWMEEQRVLAVKPIIPPTEARTVEDRDRFYSAVLEKVRTLPGVASAAFTPKPPLRGRSWGDDIQFREAPRPPADVHLADFYFISPGYSSTIGLPLIKGRLLSENDRGKDVVLISESVARRLLPGRNPIGMHLMWSPNQAPKPREVIGVVGDVRTSPEAPPALAVYVPIWSFNEANETLVVRARTDSRGIAAAIRRAFWSVDLQVAVPREETLKTIVQSSIAPRRYETSLGALFAVCAVLLAAIGLYGVISYSVSQRTHEIGIRMALGAQKLDVLRSVVGQGMAVALMGVAIGVAGALGLTRFVSSMLYGVKPTDPLTFIVVSVILTVVALLASYIPARRAAKVDPMVALRYE
jgi:predicted permease